MLLSRNHFDLVLVFALCIVAIYCRVPESERVQNWYDKGNTWPPTWQEETEEFKTAMLKREKEILNIPGANERWENWVQFTQTRMVPKFTEFGFELVQTPPFVHEKLKSRLDEALKDWDGIRNESVIDVIYTPIPSKFVDMGSESWRILEELKPYHEQWVNGMELEGTSAYGIRLYRDGASLVMHYDKTATHVISSIVHVGHEYDDDNEPWPIEIEDHNGKLHAINLEAGQMLFYESAKCVHGRRKIFKGKYYAGIFFHYRPVDRSIWNFTVEDVIANVPPHWRDHILEETGNRWAGSGMTVDSLVSAAAPPRKIKGVIVEDMAKYYNETYGLSKKSGNNFDASNVLHEGISEL